jgi:hypothetical protein
MRSPHTPAGGVRGLGEGRTALPRPKLAYSGAVADFAFGNSEVQQPTLERVRSHVHNRQKAQTMFHSQAAY